MIGSDTKFTRSIRFTDWIAVGPFLLHREQYDYKVIMDLIIPSFIGLKIDISLY